jgi:hypothetical protein
LNCECSERLVWGRLGKTQDLLCGSTPQCVRVLGSHGE